MLLLDKGTLQKDSPQIIKPMVELNEIVAETTLFMNDPLFDVSMTVAHIILYLLHMKQHLPDL